MQKNIIVVFTLAVLYLLLIVYMIGKIVVWGGYLTKIAVLWIISVGFVLIVNINKISENKKYFKSTLIDNIKYSAILAFIINFYAFNMTIELITIPLIAFIFGASYYLGTKEEYKPAKHILDSILGLYGFSLMIFTLYNIYMNYQDLYIFKALITFFLPMILTLVFIPYLYLFALYATYETAFLRLGIFIKDRTLLRYTRHTVFKLCFLNLSKLNRFMNANINKFVRLNNRDDLINLIKVFKKHG
jgi:hypothetical protein